MFIIDIFERKWQFGPIYVNSATRLPSKLASELLTTGRATWHTCINMRHASNSAAETSNGLKSRPRQRHSANSSGGLAGDGGPPSEAL